MTHDLCTDNGAWRRELPGLGFCPTREPTRVHSLPSLSCPVGLETYSVRTERSWAMALSGSVGARPDGTLHSQR